MNTWYCIYRWCSHCICPPGGFTHQTGKQQKKWGGGFIQDAGKQLVSNPQKQREPNSKRTPGMQSWQGESPPALACCMIAAIYRWCLVEKKLEQMGIADGFCRIRCPVIVGNAREYLKRKRQQTGEYLFGVHCMNTIILWWIFDWVFRWISNGKMAT